VVIDFMCTRTISRIFTVSLLGVMVAAAAGGMCLLPAASAHPAMAGCHSAPVSSHPRPADYSCCLNRHLSALVASVFSPRPATQTSEIESFPLAVAADSAKDLSTTLVSSGSPPGVVNLRI